MNLPLLTQSWSFPNTFFSIRQNHNQSHQVAEPSRWILKMRSSLRSRFLIKVWKRVRKTSRKFDKALTKEGKSKRPRPCEQWFLDNLVKGLRDWSNNLIFCAPLLKSMHQELDDNAYRAFRHVSNIMDEYQRLEKYPNLYPSAASRVAFTENMKGMISNIADTMESIAVISVERVEDPLYIAPRLSRKVRGVYYRLPFPEPDIVSIHGPSSTDKRKLWNKWFDNYDLTRSIICQSLPATARQMLTTTAFMHQTVRQSYQQVCRSINQPLWKVSNFFTSRPIEL